MRWSKITALTRLGENDSPAPVSAAAPMLVLPSPTEYRRSAEAQRSRLGYTIAVVAALLAALATFWLPTHATPYFERLVFGPRPQSRPALTKDASASPVAPTQQARSAGSTAPTPASALPAPQPGAASGVAGDQPQAERQAISTVRAAPPTAASAVPAVTVAATRPATTPASTVLATPAPAKPDRVYTVQPGDTLFSIARRSGTTVDALVTANGLGSPSAVLSIGRQLTIP